MLELRDVTINLKKDNRTIVDDFSFTLKSGDKAVIIGEEGNGKSTLLKFVYDQSLIDSYCDYSGKIVANAKTAYLPQMMEQKYFDMTLAEYFESSEYYNNISALSQLGLSVEFILSEQKLGSLSGGEKVKVQLLRLLLDEPDILLLDEPTNDLDIDTLIWLEGFIANSRLPILYISHDETLIENTANVFLHMEQLIRKTKCRISVARCSYREYLAFRKNQFERQEQVAQKQRDDYAKQKEKWLSIYNSVNHEQNAVSRRDPSGARLLKKKMHSVLSMGKRFEREKENFTDFPLCEESIITKFDERISLPEGKTVIDFSLDRLAVDKRVLSENIKLHVFGGEHIGIIGRNGCGKSTLLNLLRNELKNRRDIKAAFMPQNYADALDYNITPIDYLAESKSKEDVTKARTYMGSMKFTHEEMTGKIGQLSGGQRAKILFLKMVFENANVLILDEPTRNFSPLSGPVVRAALGSFGGTIISVSHDRKYLSEVCDKVFELRPDGLFEVNIQ